MTKVARNFYMHQLSLVSLHEKFGTSTEDDVAAKIIEDINNSQEIKFELKSKTFEPESGYTSDDGSIHGFLPLFYSRTIKVLHPLMAEYSIFEYVSQEEHLVFHWRPGYLFAMSFGTYYELIKPYCCKKFPLYVYELAMNDVIDGFEQIPSSSPLLNLDAFKHVIDKNVKMKIGDCYVHFKVRGKVNIYGIPEMQNYFIEHCKLVNDEDNKTE